MFSHFGVDSARNSQRTKQVDNNYQLFSQVPGGPTQRDDAMVPSFESQPLYMDDPSPEVLFNDFDKQSLFSLTKAQNPMDSLQQVFGNIDVLANDNALASKHFDPSDFAVPSGFSPDNNQSSLVLDLFSAERQPFSTNNHVLPNSNQLQLDAPLANVFEADTSVKKLHSELLSLSLTHPNAINELLLLLNAIKNQQQPEPRPTPDTQLTQQLQQLLFQTQPQQPAQPQLQTVQQVNNQTTEVPLPYLSPELLSVVESSGPFNKADQPKEKKEAKEKKDKEKEKDKEGRHSLEVKLPAVIHKYTPKEREARLERYRDKKARRNFSKKIRYQCRKKLADTRPRYKGRFCKELPPEALAELQQQQQSLAPRSVENDNSTVPQFSAAVNNNNSNINSLMSMGLDMNSVNSLLRGNAGLDNLWNLNGQSNLLFSHKF